MHHSLVLAYGLQMGKKLSRKPYRRKSRKEEGCFHNEDTSRRSRRGQHQFISALVVDRYESGGGPATLHQSTAQEERPAQYMGGS